MSGMHGERVIAVGGAKGGVGKTTSSLNLAAAMASAGAEVVVIEFDLAMANILDFLDIGDGDDHDVTFHEVLAGEVGVLDALYTTTWGFDVIPSGTSIDGYAKIDLEESTEILSWLRNLYDVVLLDTPAGLSRETVRPFQLADEVLVVSTPRASAIRNAANTIELAERTDTPVTGLVLTKSGTGKSPGGERIAEYLGLELLGHVPEDDAVPHSQDSGQPVLENAPRSGPAIAYRTIAGTLLDVDIPTPTEDTTEHKAESTVEASRAGPAGTDETAAVQREKLADGSGTDKPSEESRSQSDGDVDATEPVRAPSPGKEVTADGTGPTQTRMESTETEETTSAADKSAQAESIDEEGSDGGGVRGSKAQSGDFQSRGEERHLRGKISSWLGR